MGTCERCGNFMCMECGQAGSSPTCLRCRELAGAGVFPFARANWSFNALWDYCWELFKREWLMLSVAALVLFAVSGVGGVISSILQLPFKDSGVVAAVATAVIGQVIAMVLQGMAEMGMLRIVFDVLQGQKADLSRLSTQVPKIGKYVVQKLWLLLLFGVPVVAYFVLLIGVGALVSGAPLNEELFEGGRVIQVLVLGSLVALVPIVYFAVPLYFATMEIVFVDGVRPFESIKNCYAIAKGQRLTIFGVALLAALIILVGLIACCIGILPALGLGQLLLAGVYLALRSGAEVRQPGARA